MPQPTPKFRNRGEASHWSRVKAATVATWNWPAKRKQNVDFVVELASQIADKSLLQYRKRVKS